jgi:16S rRNA (uracil1498-N3)-methyltransferase
MNRFFIKHKLSEYDITHLSDTDSEYAIHTLDIKVEEIIEIETYEAIYFAIVTNIESNSVEVEIREEIMKKNRINSMDITIVQSLIGRNKFNFFLEKATELGVDRVIPIESQYSTIKKNKSIKSYGLWRKIISDSIKQSRNIKPLIIEKPIKIKDLQAQNVKNKICLATENVHTISLSKYLNNVNIKEPFVIAIGPEKGWSSKDIEILKNLDFKFIKLQGNILRTESVGLIISSIIKYLKGDI